MADIDGEKVARGYRTGLAEEVGKLKEEGIVPRISPLLVGDDPGNRSYYRAKRKAAGELGIDFSGLKLPAEVSPRELAAKIENLNRDSEVDGIILELPLPEGFDQARLKEKIEPAKDVDCVTSTNLGQLMAGGAASRSYEDLRDDPRFLLPATPYAVMEILRTVGVELKGEESVVVGAGHVGLPLAILLLREGLSTVSICEYEEKDLAEKTRRADLLCSTVGKEDLIEADMVAEGAVVVDIGMSSTEGGLVGDVDYENVREKASLITPVPGGIGPMTTTMIMANTVKAARRRKEGKDGDGRT